MGETVSYGLICIIIYLLGMGTSLSWRGERRETNGSGERRQTHRATLQEVHDMVAWLVALQRPEGGPPDPDVRRDS